jgi:hypothetical protein
MIIWRSMFEDPLPQREIMISVSVMLLHIALFIGITLFYYSKKDILS